MAIQKYKGHLALLGAAIMWGLMSRHLLRLHWGFNFDYE